MDVSSLKHFKFPTHVSEETRGHAYMTGQAAKIQETSEVEAFLSQVGDLPTLPLITARLGKLLDDDSSTIAEITDVLKKDQSLTAKLLKLANSSYYAIPGGVKDLDRAMTFLGFNTVAQLVLGVSVISAFEHLKNDDFHLSSFWKHSLACALGSEQVAKKRESQLANVAFTAGLLHDIGKLALLWVQPEQFSKLVQQARSRETSFYVVEKEAGGLDHASIGAGLAERWGLPQTIVQAIRYHHIEPEGGLNAETQELVSIVHLSNQLCVKNGFGRSGDCSKGVIPQKLLGELRMDASLLQEIEKGLEQSFKRTGNFLDVVTSTG